MTEPVVTEPVVTEPVVTEPVVTEPVVTEPVVTAPRASYKPAETTAPTTEDVLAATVPEAEGELVGSIDSQKYHKPSCRWVKKILPENTIWFASIEAAQAAGYTACGTCHPG